jgi:hypothetical protein
VAVLVIGQFDADTTLWPAMVALNACVCETLEAQGLLPDDCFCGIIPGSQASFDYQNGMVWLRLVGAFPSNNFPTQEQTLRGSCTAPLAAELEIGVLHCAPMMSSTGVPPSLDEQYEATRLQLATMAALRSAITCCTDDFPILLGEYTPISDGGLVGATWQVWVGQED